MRILLQITLIFTLIVILMGAYTRLSDAGLGCPDWPGCYGQLKVPSAQDEIRQAQAAYPLLTIEQDKAWLEMIHRYIAGTLGLMVFAIWVYCLRTPNTPKRLASIIAGLIVFQAALGMWTVTLKLMPIIVMAHLVGGFSLLALLLLLYLRAHPSQIETENHAQIAKLQPFAMVCLGVLIVQIILGGWTSSNYAALSCTTLPLCEGEWQSNLDFKQAFNPFQGQHDTFEFGVLDYAARMTIHVSHRIWALVTLVMLGTLAWRLFKSSQTQQYKRASIYLSGALFIQFCLGISNIIFHLPLGIAVAHNGMAALLLLTLVYLNFLIWHQAKYARLPYKSQTVEN